MSQSEIFRTAIAAKLKGDDAAFAAAIKEAIKEKTKSLLGESQGQEDIPVRPGTPAVQEVDDDWYLIQPPFLLEEGNVAGLPAGQYSATVNAIVDDHSLELGIELVEVHPSHGDQVLATLQGEQAEQFFQTSIPQEIQQQILAHAQSNQDGRAERDWERRNNAY